jgi:hypothetical protein
MPSTYSTDLKLELMVTGEASNTWGDKTNSNWNLIQQAVAGYQSIALTSTSTTLVMTNASISDARNMVLEFTGTLSGNSTITIPDGIEKFYLLKDSTTHGVYTLTFKTASGTGFDLTSGLNYFAYSNGTNVSEVSLDNIGGSVSTAQIEDNAITSAKISANQITTAKIADFAIVTSKISANQISTALLADDAVTASKLSRKFTISTSNPTGGSDGDLWFKYTP